MKSKRFKASLSYGLAAASLLSAVNALAADSVRVGFLSTLSGPGAGLGIDVRDGFNLALKQTNGTLGGLPAEVIIADDQQSPDTAKQTAERMLKRDKVNFMTGVIFGNVMLAVGPAAFQAKTFFISPNSGPSQYAGAQCNPYFFNVSTQNDGLNEVMGRAVADKGYKKVALIAPNYPSGKDALSGFKRFYKGEVAMESYPPLTQLDFGAELTKLRASGADAVYIFLPGGLGVNFIKQYVAAGLSKQIPLFAPGFSADQDVIGAVGDAMVGTFNSSNWAYDLDNPTNRRFVREYQQAYNRLPTLYAAQGYDAARLMDAAVRDVKGNLDDKDALRAALQAARFDSVRGAFKFNTNQYPIQDFYLREVVKDGQGQVTNRLVGRVMQDHPDAYASECKMP